MPSILNFCKVFRASPMTCAVSFSLSRSGFSSVCILGPLDRSPLRYIPLCSSASRVRGAEPPEKVAKDTFTYADLRL